MAKQYWLGEYFVDLSRNQISQHTQSQTLPPKALAVLTHLAENQGKVVTYDELLDKVWPNAVVTPNTLQRSIAQLRKALGENSKAQEVIKTHAKQGYSLECDVTWFEEQTSLAAAQAKGVESPTEGLETDSAPATHFAPAQDENVHSEAHVVASTDHSKKTSTLWIMAAVIIIIATLFVLPVRDDTSAMKFSDLRYITATDDKEYGAIYSPDGRYIVFNRYFEKLCINHIMAKDAQTMEEFQLTEERATYGGHTLSPDGKTLAYIKHEDCTKPVTQNVCYRLMSLDFEKGLTQPQASEELLRCENSAIRDPLWVDNQHIAMMQHDGERWRLIRFSVADKTSATLFAEEGGNIQSFAYSAQNRQFAVTSMKNDGLQYIEMLTEDGSVLSSHPIVVPQGAPRFMLVKPVFSPVADDLAFSYGGQLYTLTAEGEVSKVEMGVDQRIGGPVFHPDGDRLLGIKGIYDGDVATLSLPDDEGTPTLSVFERSIEEEQVARFQPDSDGIAFISERTGEPQIWLTSASGTRMISQFPKGTNLSNMRWDATGETLLVHSERELYYLSPGAAANVIPFEHPVLQLYHWDSGSRLVVAGILVNGLYKFVEIDLSSLAYRLINNHKVKWATKSANSPLVYIDTLGRIWQYAEVEAKLIGPLGGQGSEKGFVVDEQTVYGINRDNQLWSYELTSGELQMLAEVTPDIDYLTDARGDQLLLSMVIAAKKEVIELSVSR